MLKALVGFAGLVTASTLSQLYAPGLLSLARCLVLLRAICSAMRSNMVCMASRTILAVPWAPVATSDKQATPGTAVARPGPNGMD